MSRRKLKAGSTSQTVPVFIQDTSSTTGAGLGSLVFNTSSLAAKYRREGQSTWTTITLATATVGTWTSGGFVSDGGPVTGTYEVGVPNAVLAAGAKWAEVAIYGAANMLPVLLEFELDTIDYQATDGVLPANVVLVNSADATGLSTIMSDYAAGTLNANLGLKVLGGGSATITGTGVRAVDSSGAAIAPAATALSSATWTPTRAGYLDNLSGGAVALASTALSSANWTSARAGYLDSLNTGVSLAAGAVTAAALSDAGCNRIADHVRRRSQANVEASSYGDTLTLFSEYGFIQQAQESSASGTTLTVKKTDGSTQLGTRTLTVNASADPITGVS